MKIGVIGLGLIGGSIFKRLIKSGYDVIGISSSQTGEAIYNDYSVLKYCGAVFVCTPMNTVLDILDEIAAFVLPDTLVTDVSSLKEFVADNKYPFNFIPSHPMAGTEFSGYDNSSADMFEGAKWVITPLDNSDTGLLENLIKAMGAEPVFANAKEHDEAAALVSHMPMVLAQALFQTAKDNTLAMKLASSGFRDMTRLASSNTLMALDMVKMNSDNIQNALLKLYASIGDLLKNYNKNTLENIANSRSRMYKNGRNII